MAKGDAITTKFVVDISDLKKGISEANSQIKLANAQFKAASAGMDDWAKSADGISAKLKQLDSVLAAEKQKLTAYQQELTRNKEAYAENGSRAEALKAKLQELANNGVSKTSAEYKKYENELAAVEKEQAKNEKSIDNLNNQIKLQEAAVQKTENEIGSYQKKLDSLDGEQEDASKSAEELAKDTKEAGNAAKESGDGFTVLKGALANLVADGFRLAIQAAKDFAKSTVEAGMNFDSAMSQVSAVSGATGDELQSLRDKAKEMGAKTKFSATESAEAFNYMAMAGWKTEDMLNGIDGLMSLAAASGEDLAATSDIVTDALTAFGMQAGDAGHFSDVLAAASSNANTNVHMMGETFKYAAPMAGALGYSVEDVAIASGLMANSGIKAGKAGSTLRNMLANMANPTEKVAKAMDILGVSLDDGEGNMKSLMEIMTDLRSGFGNVKIPMDELQNSLAELDSQLEAGEISEKQYNKAQDELMNRAYGAEGALKAQTAAMLVGKGGLSGLLAIVNSSDQDFNKLTESVYGCEGAAKTMADTMVDNLGGDITMTKSALEGLQLTLYETANSGMRNIVQSVKDEFIPAITDMVNGTEGAEEKVGAAFGSLINNVVNEITKLLPKFGKVAVSLIQSLLTGIKENANKIAGAALELATTLINGILDALPSVVDAALKLGAALIQGLGQAIPEIVNKAIEIIPQLVSGLLSGTEQLLQAGLQLLMGIVQAIPSFVASLVAALPQIITTITGFMTSAVPMLIDGGIQLFYALIEAIPQVLPPLLAALPQIITSLVDFFIRQRETFMQAAVQLLMGLVGAIPEVITALVAALPDIIQAILDGLSDIPSLLKDLFLSAWEGIKSVFSGVGDFFKNIFGKGKKNIEDEWSDMGQWSDNKNKEIEKPFESTPKYFGDKFADSQKEMDKSFASVGTWAEGKRSEVNTAFQSTDEWFGNKYDQAAAAMDKSFSGVGKWAEGERKQVDEAFQSTDEWFGKEYEAAANQMDNSFKDVGSWAKAKRKNVDDAFSDTDTFFKGKFDAAKSSMNTSWSDVGTWSEGKAESLEKPFESVDTWFGAKFKETFAAIQKEFDGWDTYWSGLYNTIVDKFKSIGTSVGSAIGGSFKSAMNAAMASAQSAVNRGIDSINTAIGQMNAIQGVSVGRIGYVSFPRLAKGGVLKKGQIGFLEGSGAEAVVPLEKNKKWIAEVADDMVEELQKDAKRGSAKSMSTAGGADAKELKKLNATLQNQNKTLDEYKAKLAETEEQYIKVGNRIVKLTGQLEDLKAKGVSESSEEYQKYSVALEKAEAKQEKLEASIAKTYDQMQEAKAAVAETTEAIAVLDGATQNNIATTVTAAAVDGSFSESQDKVAAKVETLTARLAAQEKDLETYKRQLANTEIAYGNNVDKIDKLKAKLKELKEKGVSPTSEEYKKYQSALELAQSKQDYLQKAVDSLVVSIDYEQAAIVRTSGELSKYQGMQEANAGLSEKQAAAVKKIIDNMEKEGKTTDDLQAKLSELNATLDAQQSKYDWTNAKLNKQTEALEAQSAKVDYLKEKMEQLAENGVSKTDEKYVKYAEKLEKAEAKQAKLQESVAKLVAASEKQEAAVEATSTEISNYEEALKALGVTQSTATDYTDDQVSSNSAVESSEASLASETEKLGEALSGVNGIYQQTAKLLVDLEKEFKTLVEKSIANGKKAVAELATNFNGLRKPINDAMKKFDQLETKLGTLYNNVIAKFKGIGSAVAAGISGAFKTSLNSALAAAEKAVNDGIDSINEAIEGMNAIDGVSIEKIKKVKFPQMATGGVLKRGQVGILEGSGAEAVVPLEKNKQWIKAVAADMLDTLRVSAGITTSSSIVNNRDYNFVQNIYAPKQPTRIEIYRQTRNLLSYAAQG